MGIKSFRNQATEDINYGRSTKESRRCLPSHLHEKAQIKLARLGAATSLRDLQEVMGNRFEALKGDRQGLYILLPIRNTYMQIEEVGSSICRPWKACQTQKRRFCVWAAKKQARTTCFL